MSVLNVSNDAELLSYIINVEPVLRDNIDLPVQGESIAPIGRIIVNNERYKNAFINAINVIGLTMIDRNYWEDPWENFTNNGYMSFGDSARELAVDLADVFDYNTYATDVDHFLENVVSNIYEYIHPLNYQKFYKTTTSDAQMAMAFNTEGGLMSLIDEIISSLYEGYKYDKYIVNKYMLCRRILDGTVTPVYIANYNSLSARERVAKMKNISNLMTFRNPNYNPAGLRIATPFSKQIAIVNTDFEASLSTEVLATSFFRNDAEMKSRMALVDGYGNHDGARLLEVLGDQYIPFTEGELTALAKIPAVLIDDEFFQNKTYRLDGAAETDFEGVMTEGAREGFKRTSFYNPETLKNNHWLHYWGIKSTSPFKQAVVFTLDSIAVSSIAITPSTATVNVGQSLQLKATVSTTGFANKAVTWSVDSTSAADGIKISNSGLLSVPSTATTESVTVTAKSVYDTSVTNTASITVNVPEVPTTPPTEAPTTPSTGA